MEVTLGISTDYAKEKFSVTLNETDLIRLINELGIAQAPEQLPTWQAYGLLVNEAERFVIVQSPKFGRTVEDARLQLAQNRESMAAVLSVITGLSLDETRKRVMPETLK